MGHEPPLHPTAARSEGLLTEPRGEVGCMQHDAERVDNKPLLVLLEDIEHHRLVSIQALTWQR